MGNKDLQKGAPSCGPQGKICGSKQLNWIEGGGIVDRPPAVQEKPCHVDTDHREFEAQNIPRGLLRGDDPKKRESKGGSNTFPKARG